MKTACRFRREKSIEPLGNSAQSTASSSLPAWSSPGDHPLEPQPVAAYHRKSLAPKASPVWPARQHNGQQVFESPP
jgi:hypothetical protein